MDAAAGRSGRGTTIMARRMGAAEWGLLVSLSILWGGSFFFAGLALTALPPFTIVALRVGIAAVVLLALLPLIGIAMPGGRRVRLAFLGMGLLNNVLPFSLIVWGQTQIASGLASILNATTPLFGVLVAHVCTRDERLTPPKAIGLLLGFAGVALTVGPVSVATGPDAPWGALAVLGAALSYGFAGVYGRRFARMGIAPAATAAGQLCASALVLWPVALLVDRPWTLPPAPAPVWAAILGLALLSTALAYVLFFRLLAAAGATNLMLVTFLIPVTAIALGTLALGETLDARHLAGMALVAAGLAAIDGRAADAARRRLGLSR